jgi:uncharacterized protein (TIGR00369 family)
VVRGSSWSIPPPLYCILRPPTVNSLPFADHRSQQALTAILFPDNIGTRADGYFEMERGDARERSLAGGPMRRDNRADQYGVVPTETAKTMPGLELLTAIMEGTLPAPPIQQVLDFRLVKVERGYVAFAGTPKFEYYNPIGSVHGGYTAALLDSCMACAVHTMLEAGYGYATLEVKINYVRPITSETGLIRAEGKVIHSGKRIATAEGRLFDSAEKLYAHGTTTCLILTL